MIVDIDKYNAIAKWSRGRILCRCDLCGKEKLIVKESLMLTRNGEYILCQPCTASSICKNNIGIKRSEQHKIRTGLASKGRIHSPETRAKIGASHSGYKNKNWNPDREAIKRNDRARRATYSILHSVLRRCNTLKSDKTSRMLGYSPQELYDHITSRMLPNMSWEARDAWHIDHIKPVKAFRLEGITDPKIINALDNLAPIWKHENLLKGAKFEVVSA